MKALLADPPHSLRLDDFADPALAPQAEVVQVRAAALTNLDIMIAEGRHYLKPQITPFVVGKEALGIGPDGRRCWYNVVSLIPPYGSMAERTLAVAGSGIPVPAGVDDLVAAALGNAGLAAWLPLSWRARLKRGESVLVLGATGVAGMIAVAAAKALGAGRIIAAGRRADRLALARDLGADETIDLKQEDLGKAFAALVEAPVDVVLDYVNGPPAEAALHVMAPGGRMVQIGSTGAPGIMLNAGLARQRSLDVLGFAYYHTPRALQVEAYGEVCKLAMNNLVGLVVDDYPLDRFGEAWAAQKAGWPSRKVIRMR